MANKITEELGTVGDIVVGLNCNICLLKGETLRQMYIKLMEDELAEVIYPVVDVEPHLCMVNPERVIFFPYGTTRVLTDKNFQSFSVGSELLSGI